MPVNPVSDTATETEWSLTQTPARARWRTLPDLALLLLVAVTLLGVGMRLREWLADRGFWNDELYVAMNFRNLGVSGLFGALAYRQVAPPGWLIGEKVVLKALGESEVALRAPSLVAAIGVLVLTAVAGRRVIGRWGAVLACVLVTFSPLLQYYAGELKQYSVESFVAMGMLVLSHHWAAARRRTVRAALLALAWTVAGTVAAFVSYSALLVLVACLSVLGLVMLYRRWWHDLLLLLAASLAPMLAAGFLVERRLSLPQLANLNTFFPTGFPPEDPSPGTLLRWLPRMWTGLVEGLYGWVTPLLALVLVIAGLAALALRRQLVWALMTSLLGLAAVGAAAVHGLPLQGRVALYLAAPGCILVAAAADGAIRMAVRALRAARSHPAGDDHRSSDGDVAASRSAGIRPWLLALPAGALAVVAVTAVLVVTAPAVRETTAEAVDPLYRDPVRDVILDVAQRRRPGDVVLLYNFSEPAGSWYGRHARLDITGSTVLTTPGHCQPATLPRALSGADRVWYVHGALLSIMPLDYNLRTEDALREHGHLVDRRAFGGNDPDLKNPGWTLIDLTTGPDTSTPDRPPLPAFGCLMVVPFQR